MLQITLALHGLAFDIPVISAWAACAVFDSPSVHLWLYFQCIQRVSAIILLFGLKQKAVRLHLLFLG